MTSPRIERLAHNWILLEPYGDQWAVIIARHANWRVEDEPLGRALVAFVGARPDAETRAGELREAVANIITRTVHGCVGAVEASDGPPADCGRVDDYYRGVILRAFEIGS